MADKQHDAPSIRVARTVDAAAWDSYVATHPDTTGYHQWRWRRVFEQGLGHACHYLVAGSGTRVLGVLPLVEVTSWLFGRALSSLPYVNYGGVLADSQSVANSLVERAGEFAQDRGLDYVLLRDRRRNHPQLPARTHKVSMVLPLQNDAARMWDVLDRKVRNQIRKAEKSGLSVETGGEELLDDFYAVFARNMRDLGTPVYSRRLFAEIVACDPRHTRLHVVRLGSQPIAGALSYAYGRSLEVPSASSLKEHRALCPNHLMYWTMIRHAIDDGRTVFDFGRSTPGDGTYHFKEQWGAVPEPLFWEYKLVGESGLPEDDRQSSRYQARIEAWKRVPLSLTMMLGPRIARCVP
jgi:FemAB-related protein (PEP-CTERM system-associated)